MSGSGRSELAEEDVGHPRVVVLAGVDDALRRRRAAASARMTGAAFMKFGRAPTTWTTRLGHAGDTHLGPVPVSTVAAGIAQPAPRRRTWRGRTSWPRTLLTVSTTSGAVA